MNECSRFYCPKFDFIFNDKKIAYLFEAFGIDVFIIGWEVAYV